MYVGRRARPGRDGARDVCAAGVRRSSRCPGELIGDQNASPDIRQYEIDQDQSREIAEVKVTSPGRGSRFSSLLRGPRVPPAACLPFPPQNSRYYPCDAVLVCVVRGGSVGSCGRELGGFRGSALTAPLVEVEPRVGAPSEEA